jgi:hypothetical protein
VWHLRADWKCKKPTIEKMAAVQAWYSGFGGLEAVLAALGTNFSSAAQKQDWKPEGMVRETLEAYDEIPF